MNITIINDCHDQNALGRQSARIASLFKVTPTCLSISNDLEAAGNIIDCLDAIDNKKGIILVNVAPRHGQAKKWENGTPFGYFWYKNILIISSIDGYALSLVKKFNLIKQIEVLDIVKCTKIIEKQKICNKKEANKIPFSQFRSFDFLPRVAYLLWKKVKVASEKISIKEIKDAPNTIWWIDNFGNCKTTIFPGEINFQPGKKIKTQFGILACYNQLRDVPDNKLALTIGSSGFENKRFVEIVVQGNNAAKRKKISVGTKILI